MDRSDSACSNVSDNDNLVPTDVQFQAQNPRNSGLSEINQNACSIDKSELKKILDTVSSLTTPKVCDNNPMQNVKPRSNNKRKISECQLSSDDDEIEIVDVVLFKKPQESDSKKLRENRAEIDSCEVSAVVHADSANKECVSVGILEKDSVSMSNTPKTVGIKSNCPETCTVKDTIEIINLDEESEIPNDWFEEIFDLSDYAETCNGKDTTRTTEIKENEVPSDTASVMSNETFDLSHSSETCNGKATTKRTEIKENEVPSAMSDETFDLSNSSETCDGKDTTERTEIKVNKVPSDSDSDSDSSISDETVDLSTCSEACNGKATKQTTEIKEKEISSDSSISDETVDLSTCSEACNGKATKQTTKIKEKEISSDSDNSISDETVDLSTCSEACNGKDTTRTTEIKEKEISSDSSISDETVDLSTCSEACNGKATTQTTEIKEKEISSDSAVSNETVDPTNETFEYSSYDIDYDFNHTPHQITGSWAEFKSDKKNNFTRGCKWAPDGSCILTCSNDNKLRIFNLPSQLWDISQWCDISQLEAVLKITEADLIYDYCWNPLMNSNDAATCFLVSTSRRNTVHLWDAYTGDLRGSYRSFNHLDELLTPHSLSFNSDGTKLFCGFPHVVRIFDVNRPGRDFEERLTYSHKIGQAGIISCFAFTSADKNISAAGSYNSTIGLYAEPNGELTCLLKGQANGITQVEFSPDGQYLYSGEKKDSEILCWDIRNLRTVLFSLRRTCETNQRMYFDISKSGKYVASGNSNGIITFWDVTKEPKRLDKANIILPVNFFLAHDDCVNGISFHPSYPLFCSSSGQRKFPVLTDDCDAIFSSEVEKQDNSLRLWWIGKLDE